MALTHIRTEYERTPLERINVSIFEAEKELSVEKAKLIHEKDKSRVLTKINKLEQIISILKEEASLRKETERHLFAQRSKLIDKIGIMRQQCKSEYALSILLKKIKDIDVQLGPFRWLNQPFKLA